MTLPFFSPLLPLPPSSFSVPLFPFYPPLLPFFPFFYSSPSLFSSSLIFPVSRANIPGGCCLGAVCFPAPCLLRHWISLLLNKPFTEICCRAEEGRELDQFRQTQLQFKILSTGKSKRKRKSIQNTIFWDQKNLKLLLRKERRAGSRLRKR